MNRSQTPRKGLVAALVEREIDRDPDFAQEWAEFTAALDLRMKRKARGLSQVEVGRRIGIDQATVARIERNPSGVSLRRFRAYASAIGYSVRLVPAQSARQRPRMFVGMEASKAAAKTNKIFAA